jgi:hypothetical protein
MSETWSLTLAEERKPRVLENKVLTEIFGCKERGSSSTLEIIVECDTISSSHQKFSGDRIKENYIVVACGS